MRRRKPPSQRPERQQPPARKPLTPQEKELFESVTHDIDALDWSEQAVEGCTEDWEKHKPKLRLMCIEAVVNAIVHENRDGYQIANMADLDLADGHTIEVRIEQMPKPGISLREIWPILNNMVRQFNAVRITCPFIDNKDPNTEKLCVIQILSSGHFYFLSGRIVGTTFAREVLRGHSPANHDDDIELELDYDDLSLIHRELREGQSQSIELGYSDLYELHALYLMQRGHELGLVESTLPKVSPRGIKVLKAALACGWKPDAQRTARQLASRLESGGCDPHTALKLIEKLNENLWG